MPRDNHRDLIEAIDVMGSKPDTRSDGNTLKYLSVLAERPLFLEEFEDMPPGQFVHSAHLWLSRRPHLEYKVRIQNGLCILTRPDKK